MRTIRIPTLAVLGLLALPASGLAATPTLKVSSVSASGSAVTVKGTVGKLAKAKRSSARVTLTLTDAGGAVERFTARVSRTAAFRATRTTKLTGALTLRGRLTVSGRKVGALLVRSGAVTVGAAPTAGEGEKLIGTFKLDPGIRRPDGTHVGTYFQMLTPNGRTPLKNADSGSTDKNFSTLPPGVDGGLRTFEYQAPPVPAFSAGNALANRIVDPQKFFSYRFSIVTAATDLQTGLPVPLPEIVHRDGRLGGQITAWAAQWNDQNFNQGTPKPDGSLPGATTPLSGTYDAATRRFVLTWKSLIVGGPFDSFIGSWHLEGTFEPRA